MDTWLAQLDDGSGWTAQERALRDGEVSPWQRLEELAAETGRTVTIAAVCIGRVAVALEAEGYPLTCGQTVVARKEAKLAAKEHQVHLRWVRREEHDRWVWRATDGKMAWRVVTPPGEPLHRHIRI